MKIVCRFLLIPIFVFPATIGFTQEQNTDSPEVIDSIFVNTDTILFDTVQENLNLAADPNTLDTLSRTLPDTLLSDSLSARIDSLVTVTDSLSAHIDSLVTVTDSLSAQIDSLVTVTDSLSARVDSLMIIPDSLPDSLSLVMVGDVMLGTNYPSANYLPPGNDCWPLLSPVANYLQDADISFCNLEGVFAGEKGTPKNCRDPKTCYVFRMPDEYVSCLSDAGIDFVSVANNHVNDFGSEGRKNTIKVLNEAGINFAGFLDSPYTIFEAQNLSIGFCAFSPNIGVQDLRNIPNAEHIVKLLKDTCDIVIVSMHGGAEGSSYQNVTRKTELFLGANRGNVYEFAHRMIDAGADVVIGHGPHVTRAMEVYKERFIAYSLGNFATYGRFNISGPNGIAPLVKIYLNSEGKFLGGSITPIHQIEQGGAKPDPLGRVIYKLQELIRSDFPASSLLLDNSGLLNYTGTEKLPE